MGQEHRDHPLRLVRDPLAEGDTHLGAVPGSEPFRPEEDGTGAAGVKGPLQRLLPGLAGNELPLVEEDPKGVFVAQPARQRLDRRLQKNPP